MKMTDQLIKLESCLKDKDLDCLHVCIYTFKVN